MQKNLNPIMDFERVNQLLEDFNKSTGLVTAILDLEGNVLSQSGWRDICTLFHRKHPETAHNCLISDTELANKMGEGEKYHFYKCLNGLVDVATPIIINGEHVANLFTGQFFFEKPNIEFFRNQAKKYGFNEEKYLSALEKVPVISKEKAEANLNFLSSMAHLIGELSSQKNMLKESETLFKNIFEKSSTGKSITNLTGEIRVNQAFADMLGYSVEELQNIKWQDITPKEEIEPIQKLIEPLVAGSKNNVRFEKRYIRKDGRIIWADVSTTLQRDEKGKPEYFITAVVDITEKKITEQKLLQSEERLRLSTELGNVAVWEYDFTTNSMTRTKNHDRLYGLEWQEKWEFETFLNATHPDDREYSNSMIQQSVARGGPDNYKFDFRIVTPENEVRWLEVTGQVVERNQKGEGILVRGCLIDVTERKNTEIALRLSEEKFQSAFQISPVGVTINRISDGKFIEVNDAFLEMFEFNRDEVIGHTSLELNMMSSDERERLIKKQIETGGLRNYELKFQTKSGEPIYALFSSSPIEIEGEKCHLTIIIDISEKHYANIQLAESEKRYRSLFENMNAGFVLFEVVQDENGKTIDLIIVAANKGFEKTTGLDLRSAQGQRLTKVLPGIEKDEADWIGNYSEIARTGISKQFENYSKLLDTYYSVSAFKAGPNLCAVTFTDVTAAKKAELKLKESEAGSAKFMSSRRLPFSITTPKAI